MTKTGFAPWPSYTPEEADAVSRVLLSNRVNYWTGNEVREFEQEFAAWSGASYAIAVANGTVALEAALRALGIKNAEVIVTSRTFLASASCIVTTGNIPIFADVDKDSQNITAVTIQKVITPRTRAIICVHLAGWPCEMDAIMELATTYNLYVIEDCAQSHGALYKGRSVGSLGHVAAWSFCQDKIMTTGGEGGMLTTNNKDLWQLMWSDKDHGKSLDALKVNPVSNSKFRWLHHSFGTNLRLTEIQATIGRIQLKRMTQWNEQRLYYATYFWQKAGQIPGIRVPIIPPHIHHAAYKCYVFIELNYLARGWNRDRIINVINEQGIPCYSGSCSEVYLEKAFDNTPWRPLQRLPVAQQLGETSLAFLVHPTLKFADIHNAHIVLKQVMLKATTSVKAFMLPKDALELCE